MDNIKKIDESYPESLDSYKIEMNKEQIDELLYWGSGNLNFEKIKFPATVNDLQVFLSLKPILKGHLYWYTLGIAYTFSDYLFLNNYKDEVTLAFKSEEPGRISVMTKDEWSFFEKLPDKITIYRCISNNEKYNKDFDLAWTLDNKVAESYLTILKNSNREIYELTIKKENVIAYFNRNNESEIIYIHKPSVSKRKGSLKEIKELALV